MTTWRVLGSVVAVALIAAACPKDRTKDSAAKDSAAKDSAASSNHTAAQDDVPPPKPAGRFIEDDVDAALAMAKDAGKVVFVDGWAPWCHTCLSMQRDVLRDPSLAKYEDRVVFAAVDTDRPEAAPFVARHPLKSWPTFFVIDPVADQSLAEHGGSLSLSELQTFLDEALRARDPKAQAEPQVKELLLGHAAMGKKDFAAAAQH